MNSLATLLTELAPLAAHYDDFASASIMANVSNSLEAMRSSERLLDDDFQTTTIGRISFRRVEDESIADSALVADARLQRRLESLCDKLRSKY